MTIEDQIKELRELESLTLPDGRPAKAVRWHEIQRLLQPVLGENFSANDGKQVLLEKYAAVLRAERLADAEVSAEDELARKRAERRRAESADPRRPLRAPSVTAVASGRVPRVSARLPE